MPTSQLAGGLEILEGTTQALQGRLEHFSPVMRLAKVLAGEQTNKQTEKKDGQRSAVFFFFACW
jgi:hypothetical protein